MMIVLVIIIVGGLLGGWIWAVWVFGEKNHPESRDFDQVYGEAERILEAYSRQLDYLSYRAFDAGDYGMHQVYSVASNQLGKMLKADKVNRSMKGK